MAKLELVDIKLDQIDPNPENSQLFNMENIEHLANIIKEEGFTTPIEVYKKKDGRYEISSGHRRYEAMKYLGKKTIPCLVFSGFSSDSQKERKLLSSNIAFRRLSPLEFAKAIKCYKQILTKENYKGVKRAKVAEYFNITESNVHRYECLLNLIPELQEFCKRPSFPYSSLRKASTLTKQEQLTLYKELIRIEAETRGIAEDEVDKDEIVFSRIRVEQIINNTIKAKENAAKREQERSVVNTSPEEEFPMPAPVEEYADFLGDGIEIVADEDDEVVSYDDLAQRVTEHQSMNLLGLDQCVTTITEYSKSTKNEADKKAINAKITEIEKALEKLKKSL